MFTRPGVLLRVEEAFLLIAAILLYRHLHFSWLVFGVLFLAPDLFMLGYLVSVKVGATMYNVGHWLVLPLVVFAAGCGTGSLMMMKIAVIWFSHIAFDRMLGYGLKYPTFFKDTHLQHLDLEPVR